MGLPILTRHTYDSTLWIVTRGISDELAARVGADVVLIDRPVPDTDSRFRALAEHHVRTVLDGLTVAFQELTPETRHTALLRAATYVTARLASTPTSAPPH